MDNLQIKPISKEIKLPSNIEAEQTLIGSVLVNNDIIDEIANIVNEKEFYDPLHSKIYQQIEKLHNKGMIANPITLKSAFENESSLSEVGGTEYLVKLTRFSSSIRQCIDYAKIIHEKFVKRELIKISENLSDDAIDEAVEKTGENIIQDTEKSLFDLAERGTFHQSFLKFDQALDQTIQMATNAMKNDQGIVGVPTGLDDLDERLGGLHKSDLVIIANDVSKDESGFDNENNEVTIFYKNEKMKKEKLSLKKKSEISEEIVDRIVAQIN